MSNPLFVIQSPQAYDYTAFFDLAVSKVSPSANGLDVLVTSAIENSTQLNILLSAIYTQIRAKLVALKFPYTFPIDVYVNRVPKTVAHNTPVFHLDGETVPEELPNMNLISLKVDILPLAHEKHDPSSIRFLSVHTSAVGGTFDHLHDGHKILLSMTAFAARERIIIGVTGPELLQNKKYASVIQPLDVRVKNACKFLQKIMYPGQMYEVYEMKDVCGPTAFLPDIDALIVSEETFKGGNYVNDRRAERGFPVLSIVCAKVIGGNGSSSNNWEGKLSSTELRKLEYESSNH
ncbi:hypothetical protein JCM33374_g1000 [Metschnikowia sp. JCM 33374]|nr:hypothetical protein JCM33374_g1000 [Metschnikowia sp. JCM 33374]